ncbi:MAG: DUF4013 domain-containing protein [Anaerolineae bacterium]
MELGRALSYIFEDKNWVSKLIPLMLVGFVSAIPILGLFATALGLGYLLMLAQGVRDGAPRPLPKWDHWREMFNRGGQILLAMIFYNLPIIFISGCIYTLISGLGESLLGSSVIFLALCCTLPITLLYTVITWSMLAVGVTEYMETAKPNRLFRFAHLWDVIRNQSNLVIQWALYSTLTNIVFGLIGAIPCIGWIVALLFLYPVQGHLLGQFAHRLSVARNARRQPARP